MLTCAKLNIHCTKCVRRSGSPPHLCTANTRETRPTFPAMTRALFHICVRTLNAESIFEEETSRTSNRFTRNLCPTTCFQNTSVANTAGWFESTSPLCRRQRLERSIQWTRKQSLWARKQRIVSKTTPAGPTKNAQGSLNNLQRLLTGAAEPHTRVAEQRAETLGKRTGAA